MASTDAQQPRDSISRTCVTTSCVCGYDRSYYRYVSYCTSNDMTSGVNLTAGNMAFSEESMCAISACRFMARSLSRETSPALRGVGERAGTRSSTRKVGRYDPGTGKKGQRRDEAHSKERSAGKREGLGAQCSPMEARLFRKGGGGGGGGGRGATCMNQSRLSRWPQMIRVVSQQGKHVNP